MDQKTSVPEMAVSRDRVIIRTSIIGILTNVFLAAFKAAVGIISNSIAVILGASDARLLCGSGRKVHAL